MADDKKDTIIPNTFVEEKAPKGPKQYNYVGPRPAPLVSNLPIDLKQTRLGTRSEKYPADQLFDALGAAYVEFVMRTNTTAKDWWK